MKRLEKSLFLEKIVIFDTIKRIEEDTFYECTLFIDNPNIEMGKSVFKHCHLRKIIFMSNLSEKLIK